MTEEQLINEFKRQVRLNQGIGYAKMLSILNSQFNIQLNELEDKKQHAIVEIDFGNHLKATLKIIDNNIEVLGAINGWGDGVNQDEIKIEYLNTLNNK